MNLKMSGEKCNVQVEDTDFIALRPPFSLLSYRDKHEFAVRSDVECCMFTRNSFIRDLVKKNRLHIFPKTSSKYIVKHRMTVTCKNGPRPMTVLSLGTAISSADSSTGWRKYSDISNQTEKFKKLHET